MNNKQSIFKHVRVYKYPYIYKRDMDMRDMPENTEVLESHPEFQEVQKWLLEVEEGKTIMIHNLRGFSRQIKYVKVGDQSVPVEEWRKDDKRVAWMNEKGISVVQGKLDFYLRKDILLANLEDEQVRNIVVSFGFDLVALIADNQKEWDIPDYLRDSIITDFTNFIWMILSRPTGGGDRGFFKNMHLSVARTISNLGKKDTPFIGPFQGGNYNGR